MSFVTRFCQFFIQVNVFICLLRVYFYYQVVLSKKSIPRLSMLLCPESGEAEVVALDNIEFRRCVSAQLLEK